MIAQRLILADAKVRIGLSSANKCWSDLWSESIINLRPNRYWLNFFTPKTIGSASLSSWA